MRKTIITLVVALASLVPAGAAANGMPPEAGKAASRTGTGPSGDPAQKVTQADLALHEYTGIARYHVYNAMGWNVQATKPGAW